MITDLTDQLLEIRMKSRQKRLTIQFDCTTKRRNSECRAVRSAYHGATFSLLVLKCPSLHS